MTFIETRTQEQQANKLATYLPNNDLYTGKNRDGSNLRKVLLGLAQQWLDFRGLVNDVQEQYNPTSTTDLIEEWEAFVGIPDDCLDNTGTLEQRRLNILLKLAGINATTAQQFENIAAVLGYGVTVETGYDYGTFPFTFPFILLTSTDVPFTIVVTLDASLEPSGFPFTFPFELTSGVPNILLCFFEKLKPANTQVFFRYE